MARRWHGGARTSLAGTRSPRRNRGERGAGDGNRTRMSSLEGWGSTIELRPRDPPGTAPPAGQGPARVRSSPVAYRLATAARTAATGTAATGTAAIARPDSTLSGRLSGCSEPIDGSLASRQMPTRGRAMSGARREPGSHGAKRAARTRLRRGRGRPPTRAADPSRRPEPPTRAADLSRRTVDRQAHPATSHPGNRKNERHPSAARAGAATARGRMNSSTALANPSSSLEAVTKVACFCTSGLALPIATLSPLRTNISTSFG
jgi:hypothetical protein